MGCSSRIGAAALRQASGGRFTRRTGARPTDLRASVRVLRCTAEVEALAAGRSRGRGSVYAARLTVLQQGDGALGCPRNSLTIHPQSLDNWSIPLSFTVGYGTE